MANAMPRDYKARKIKISSSLAHARAGCRALKTLRLMEKCGTLGTLEIEPSADCSDQQPCRFCIEANLKHQDIPRQRTRTADGKLQVLSSDLQTVGTRSYDGYNYIAIYTLQNEQFWAIALLQKKNDQEQAAPLVIARLETAANAKVRTFRADLGGEFTSNSFKGYLQSKGIRQEFADTAQPFQNGQPESAGGQLFRMIRAARLRASAPANMWSEAARYFCWLHNLLSTTRQQGRTTPSEMLTGIRSHDIDRARVWGCEAWVLIRRKTKAKLEPRAMQGIFVGVSHERKAYRIYFPTTKTIIESRNCIFLETSFPWSGSPPATSADVDPLLQQLASGGSSIDSSNAEQEPSAADQSDADEWEDLADDDADEDWTMIEQPQQQQQQPEPRRSARVRAEPARFSDANYDAERTRERQAAPEPAHAQENSAQQAQAALIASAPQTEAEAALDPAWRASEQEEIQALLEAKTWEVVRRPKDKQVLPSKMVYRAKEDEHGQLAKRKSRFVVVGSADRHKAFRESFAPTMRYASMRMLFAIAAVFGMVVQQYDVKSAYLHGTLPEAIYVEQPKCHVIKSRRTHVLRVKKGLYGYASSGRCWNNRLDKDLRAIGFKRCESDPCVYVRHFEKNGVRHMTLLGTFVDDLLSCGTDNADVDRVKTQLAKLYPIKDLGEARWALGIRVTQTKATLRLDQEKYVGDVLEKFGKYLPELGRTRARTPLPQSVTYSRSTQPASDKAKEEMAAKPYRELVGALMYLAVGTRPDLAHAMGVLSRFLENPGLDHWKAALHVLSYVGRNKDMGLVYRKRQAANSFDGHVLGNDENSPIGYVDANYAMDRDDSKSTSGQVIVMAGGAISWRSKKQGIVATSTCHAEYVAAAEAAREMVWVRSLLEEVGARGMTALRLYEDNEAAIFLTNNPAVTERSKHIRIRWHFIRQCVRDGLLKLHKIESSKNAADQFTKAVPRTKLTDLSSRIGLLASSASS